MPRIPFGPFWYNYIITIYNCNNNIISGPFRPLQFYHPGHTDLIKRPISQCSSQNGSRLFLRPGGGVRPGPTPGGGTKKKGVNKKFYLEKDPKRTRGGPTLLDIDLCVVKNKKWQMSIKIYIINNMA